MTAARRLAAILAADVVGYSRLMGQDEAGTAKAVREGHEASTPTVAGHGGRIVKTTGDGVLPPSVGGPTPSTASLFYCFLAYLRLLTPYWHASLKRLQVPAPCKPSSSLCSQAQRS